MINQYIYLASSSYSGSTLLASIMNAHPEIASVGELSAIGRVKTYKDYMCSCGEEFYNCSFWNTFEKELKKISPNLTIDTVHSSYKPGINNYLDRFSLHVFKNKCLNEFRNLFIKTVPAYNNYFKTATQNYIVLAKIILKIYNKDIFFDASKNPYRIPFLYNQLGNKLKVIHLIKDGRGVLDSFLRYNPKLNEKKIIKDWVKLNKNIQHELQKLPSENTLTINYNNLTKDTNATLDKILNFIGVDFNEHILNFNNAEHHILGNTKMRLSNTKEIYFDEKWKRSLTREQLKIFESIAGNYNEKLFTCL